MKLTDAVEQVLNPQKMWVSYKFFLYQSYLTEPWFINGEEPLALRDETAIDFLTAIFDPPLEEAFRRNRGRWGLKYEHRLKRMWQQPIQHGLRRLRDRLRGKR